MKKRGPALVTLPNGLTLLARGLRRQLPGDPPPTFGLYLLSRPLGETSRIDRLRRVTPFVPSWDHARIDWPDFGVPTDFDDAAAKIRATYARIQKGETVEVACGGGVGRTGTVVACLAVLAGEHVVEAVEWVRANYRTDAVETAKQAAWIDMFNDSLAEST